MTARLPPVLRRVADQLGEAIALEIADRYSGRCMYVPVVITEDHPIAQRLGMEAAIGLAKMFRGELVDIPRCSELERERRNARLLEARSKGESVTSLTERFGLSRRQVFNVLSAARDEQKGAA